MPKIVGCCALDLQAVCKCTACQSNRCALDEFHRDLPQGPYHVGHQPSVAGTGAGMLFSLLSSTQIMAHTSADSAVQRCQGVVAFAASLDLDAGCQLTKAADAGLAGWSITGTWASELTSLSPYSH